MAPVVRPQDSAADGLAQPQGVSEIRVVGFAEPNRGVPERDGRLGLAGTGQNNLPPLREDTLVPPLEPTTAAPAAALGHGPRQHPVGRGPPRSVEPATRAANRGRPPAWCTASKHERGLSTMGTLDQNLVDEVAEVNRSVRFAARVHGWGHSNSVAISNLAQALIALHLAVQRGPEVLPEDSDLVTGQEPVPRLHLHKFRTVTPCPVSTRWNARPCVQRGQGSPWPHICHKPRRHGRGQGSRSDERSELALDASCASVATSGSPSQPADSPLTLRRMDGDWPSSSTASDAVRAMKDGKRDRFVCRWCGRDAA